MTARTEQASWPQPRTGSEGAARVWLDALSSGICTPDDFLSATLDQFQESRDEGWEVLSLLDQYYRRGKIKAELFQTLKSRLEGVGLRREVNVTARAPLHPPTTAAVTAPTAAPREEALPELLPAARELRKPREVAIGDVLRGRYEVRGVLGHGGMGTVFEAMDEYRLNLPVSGQRIAIKVLHTAVTQREALLAELQREFQHLQLLSHPNIVRVHEFDRDGDIAFFTMELLNGALLSRVLGARNAVVLPRPYALAIMRDVGAALAHAHSRGVVHGDINPQNIFLTYDGELRVLDFGASHKLPGNRESAEIGSSQRDPVATPGYASCQLLEGQPPDARDDLFAFACVAYVLLSGRHPFPNRSAVEACAQGVRPPRPPALTAKQWRVLREGLRWERDRRPADVQNWLDRFDLAAAAPHLPPLPALEHATPPRKRRVMRAAAAIIIIAVLMAGGYWAMTSHESPASLVMPPTPAVTDETPPPSVTPSAPPPSANPAALPRTTAPTATAPAAPMAAAPAAPTAAAPAAPTAAASTAAPGASTLTAAAPPATTPAPAAPLTSTPRPRVPAAATRPSAREASARLGSAGPIRVEMAADTVDVQAGEPTARVTIRRKGSLRGDASFTWWTETGTAKPDRDFAPVVPRVEHIADGKDGVSLSIPLVGTPSDKPRSFYVVIGRTESGGAALGARNLTMVTIQPPE